MSRLVAHMILGVAVHFIHIHLIVRQGRHSPAELPAMVEDEEPRSVELHHVLEARPQMHLRSA